jgi:hypothetical protein
MESCLSRLEEYENKDSNKKKASNGKLSSLSGMRIKVGKKAKNYICVYLYVSIYTKV